MNTFEAYVVEVVPAFVRMYYYGRGLISSVIYIGDESYLFMLYRTFSGGFVET